MQLVVFEDHGYRDLLPLVYTRATFNLRCGFDNLLDKIESAIGVTASAVFVRPTIAAALAERQRRAVNQPADSDDQLWINGRLLLRRWLDLPPRAAVYQGDTLLVARIDARLAARLSPDVLLDSARLRAALSDCLPADISPNAAVLIDHPWQLVKENAAEIVRQFRAVPIQVEGQVYSGAHLVNPSAIHVGVGAKIKPGAVLDAEEGPIFIDDEAILHPNVTIQGPCFIGRCCVIHPGARIRSGSSIHMASKVAGEIEGTIFHGYSNKQHDGFLGHSYVGEWVNLGADTVNSDLKNTYGLVRVWINGRKVDSGEQFVGGFIGDHAKTGVNVALPTGCVIGFAGNVVVGGYVPKFVPSFSWLTDAGREEYAPARALAVAEKVVARRGRTLSETERALFLSVAEEAKRHETR
jgi:UDP-N-acetylglucosamine diphosphorylase/glucosamine-1-phosphate N-acetyltransferase